MVHPPPCDVISQKPKNAFEWLSPSGSNQYIPSPLECPFNLMSRQLIPRNKNFILSTPFLKNVKFERKTK